jgi:hypothetical protein
MPATGGVKVLNASGGANAASTVPLKAQGIPSTWDYSADVVVVGYGASASCAAIAAADAGASVMILEKAPKVWAHGDSNVFGGGIGILNNDPVWVPTYLSPTWIAEVKQETAGTWSDSELQILHDAFQDLPWWLNGLGVKAHGGHATGNGPGLMGTLTSQVQQRGIPVMYETPATDLVQDPSTKEILGVVAQTGITWTRAYVCDPNYEGGTEIYVKANKGVVLATGDYCNNPEMVGAFNLPALYVPTVGGPYNTGDGHKLAMGVGCDLWHFADGFEHQWYGFKVPSRLYGTAIGWLPTVPDEYNPPGHSYIFVDRYGKRFTNEERTHNHDRSPLDAYYYRGDNGLSWTVHGYPHSPMWLICDQNYINSGPIGGPNLAARDPPQTGNDMEFNEVRKIYVWSKDNSAELAQGWIFQASTIAQLAAVTTGTDWYGNTYSPDPVGLAATITQFNANCASGSDTNFGDPTIEGAVTQRPASTLQPIVNPPFYAAELMMSSAYAMGGPKHTVAGQVVNVKGVGIPRLYVAGNVGNYEWLKNGGMEAACATGRIAGTSAAALESRE